MARTLLIIEDEAMLGSELKRHFQHEGWRVMLTDSLAATRRELYDNGLVPLVVLSDMSLPDGNALDLLEEIREQKISGEWLFLTGYGSVADSVRAMHLGAYDFLEKPVDFERLNLVVNGAARSAMAQRRLHDQLAAGSSSYTPEGFVGQSNAARQIREMLGKLAAMPISSLIITGETGTGKGVVARILHHSGPRNEAPLIEVNCSALPKDLLESELFGHEAGAFTGAKGRRRGLFEQADGGTLFLDEIGEMPVELQAKLLKVLDEKYFRRVGGDREIHVDVQVFAATNRDLPACVRDGSFREDLYHRLSVFELSLPPLRDRIQDLDELVPVFVAQYNTNAGKHVSQISTEFWGKLKAHAWPGNVRELRNVIERCVLFADGNELPLQWLQLHPKRSPSGRGETGRGTGDAAAVHDDSPIVQLPLDGSLGLDEMNRRILCAALERNQYNVTATAQLLNTTRDTLRYRIRKYEIELPDNA